MDEDSKPKADDATVNAPVDSAEASTSGPASVQAEGTVANNPAVEETESKPAESNTAPVSEEALNDVQDKTVANNSEKPKSKMRAMLIIIIALILVGLAVYLYYNTNQTDTASTDNSTQSTAQNQNGSAPATAADVDALTQEIDQAITSADELDDADISDLSSSSLDL